MRLVCMESDRRHFRFDGPPRAVPCRPPVVVPLPCAGPLVRNAPRKQLSPMANYALSVEAVFQALGDPTRRAVVDRLSAAPASVGELAGPFEMALPSFMKYIRHLELAGLITTSKAGRGRTCNLQPALMAVAESWLARQRELWEPRTDRLEQFVTTTHPRSRPHEK